MGNGDSMTVTQSCQFLTILATKVNKLQNHKQRKVAFHHSKSVVTHLVGLYKQRVKNKRERRQIFKTRKINKRPKTLVVTTFILPSTTMIIPLMVIVVVLVIPVVPFWWFSFRISGFSTCHFHTAAFKVCLFNQKLK